MPVNAKGGEFVRIRYKLYANKIVRQIKHKNCESKAILQCDFESKKSAKSSFATWQNHALEIRKNLSQGVRGMCPRTAFRRNDFDCNQLQTGGGPSEGMGVGEHEKILLADSQQLDPCHDPDKRLSSSHGMGGPQGRQMTVPEGRLLVTAHYGPVRRVAWKGRGASTPPPIRLSGRSEPSCGRDCVLQGKPEASVRQKKELAIFGCARHRTVCHSFIRSDCRKRKPALSLLHFRLV